MSSATVLASSQFEGAARLGNLPPKVQFWGSPLGRNISNEPMWMVVFCLTCQTTWVPARGQIAYLSTTVEIKHINDKPVSPNVAPERQFGSQCAVRSCSFVSEWVRVQSMEENGENERVQRWRDWLDIVHEYVIPNVSPMEWEIHLPPHRDFLLGACLGHD